MGIKADENEPEIDPNSSTAKLLAASARPEVPEFLNKFKQMGIKADENDKNDDGGDGQEEETTSQPTVENVPEFLSKFKQMGIKADENEDTTVVDSTNSTNKNKKILSAESKQKQQHQPEWMEKFKKIGMKVDEGIVIVSSGGKQQQGNDSDDKKDSHTNSKSLKKRTDQYASSK